MTTALLILQILAALFTAGAAAASLLKSKGIQEISTPSLIIGGKPIVVRRLTREARIGVICVMAGLLVAFAARLVEQHVTSNRNASQLNRLDAQVKLAQATLISVQRILLKFDTWSASVTVELNPTNNVVAALTSLSKNFKQTTFGSFRPEQLSGGTIAGYKNEVLDGQTSTVVCEMSTQGYTVDFEMPPASVLAMSSYTVSTNDTFLRFLLSPVLYCQLTMPDTARISGAFTSPELSCSTTSGSPALVAFQSKPERVLVTWTFNFPQKDWQQTKRIRSVPDLGDARCGFFFKNKGLNSEDYKVVSASLTFDHFKIPTMAIEPLKLSRGFHPTAGDNLYVAHLPKLEEILGSY